MDGSGADGWELSTDDERRTAALVQIFSRWWPDAEDVEVRAEAFLAYAHGVVENLALRRTVLSAQCDMALESLSLGTGNAEAWVNAVYTSRATYRMVFGSVEGNAAVLRGNVVAFGRRTQGRRVTAQLIAELGAAAQEVVHGLEGSTERADVEFASAVGQALSDAVRMFDAHTMALQGAEPESGLSPAASGAAAGVKGLVDRLTAVVSKTDYLPDLLSLVARHLGNDDQAIATVNRAFLGATKGPRHLQSLIPFVAREPAPATLLGACEELAHDPEGVWISRDFPDALVGRVYGQEPLVDPALKRLAVSAAAVQSALSAEVPSVRRVAEVAAGAGLRLEDFMVDLITREANLPRRDLQPAPRGTKMSWERALLFYAAAAEATPGPGGEHLSRARDDLARIAGPASSRVTEEQRRADVARAKLLTNEALEVANLGDTLLLARAAVGLEDGKACLEDRRARGQALWRAQLDLFRLEPGLGADRAGGRDHAVEMLRSLAATALKKDLRRAAARVWISQFVATPLDDVRRPQEGTPAGRVLAAITKGVEEHRAPSTSLVGAVDVHAVSAGLPGKVIRWQASSDRGPHHNHPGRQAGPGLGKSCDPGGAA